MKNIIYTEQKGLSLRINSNKTHFKPVMPQFSHLPQLQNNNMYKNPSPAYTHLVKINIPSIQPQPQPSLVEPELEIPSNNIPERFKYYYNK